MGSTKTQVLIIAAFSIINVNTLSGPCPQGYYRDWNGRCVQGGQGGCSAGQIRDPVSGQCINAPSSNQCPAGQTRDPVSGQCINNPSSNQCPAGQTRDPISGQCFNNLSNQCPFGQTRDPLSGQCINNPNPIPRSCPIGQFRDPSTGQCVGPNVIRCLVGQVLDPVSGQCVNTNQGQQQCPVPLLLDPVSGQCVSTRNFICSLCNECCINSSIFYNVRSCYFDFAGNFEGCLTNSGLNPGTVYNLITARNYPEFQTALRSFKF